MEEGVLYFTRRMNVRGNSKGKRRICLPDSMKRQVWALCHAHPLSGHRGREATLGKMVRQFFFIGMASFVKGENEKCNECLSKVKFIKHKQKLHFPSLHNAPMSKVYVDTVSMSRSTSGMRYLLTVEDGFSWLSQCQIRMLKP